MSLTFRRLEVFVAAACDGNFRRTAERLGISEPSVSAQIHELELHLGCQLFDRRRGATSTLSARGRDFLVQARELLKAEGELAASRDAPPEAEPAVLKLSAGPILLERRIKPALAEFHERHPQIALEFLPFDSKEIGERAIRTGAIDALLYTGGPPPKTRTYSEVVTRVSCSVYGAAESHPKLARSIDVSGLPFLMPPKHYPLSRWFEAQLASMGVKPQNIVARPPYMEVVLQMVIAGKGVAVLFDEHAAEYVERGEMRLIRAMPVAAFRVMLLGRRALRPEMAPALRFLRRVACAPEHPTAARAGRTAI